MFDGVSFWEFAVIFVVAMIVFGPEKLPELVRKGGYWLAKIRAYVGTVKEEINKEIAADELKRILKEQMDKSGIYEIVEETKKTINTAEQEYMLKAILPPSIHEPEPSETSATAPPLSPNTLQDKPTS